jgi:hypothetical protein
LLNGELKEINLGERYRFGRVIEINKVERNQLCPCGSGKKYKKCCMGKKEEYGRFSLRDLRLKEIRDEMFDAISHFYSMQVTPEEEKKAEKVFGRSVAEEFPVIFMNWVITFYKDSEGKTLLERFKEKQWFYLDKDERVVVNALQNARFTLAEVSEIVKGKGVKVNDLLNEGNVFFLNDVSLSLQVHKWDVLLGMIADLEGQYYALGAGLSLKRNIYDRCLNKIRSRYYYHKRKNTDWSFQHFFDINIGSFIDIYLDELLNEQQKLKQMLLDSVRNERGEKLVFSMTTFQVRNRKAVRGILAEKLEEQEVKEGVYKYEIMTGESLDATVLLNAERGTLVLTCNSEERMREARRFIEDSLSGYVSFLKEEKMGLEEAFSKYVNSEKEYNSNQFQDEDEFLPEARNKTTTVYIEKYYREWMDKQIPALEMYTPKEAASRKSLRRKLVELVKDLENNEQRLARTQHREPIDFEWMWRELELK